MATTECLARGFEFHLNTGTIGVPVWTEIGNINTWGHSHSSNDADTTTFSDAGRMTHMKASRGDEFTLGGLYLEDPANGDRDPGQEAVEAWADEVGPDSVKQFRITSPGGVTKTFLSTAAVNNGGGGNDDPNKWDVTIKVTGTIATA